MLSHLSWTDYTQTVFWILSIYYALVLIRYYQQELIGLLFRRPKVAPTVLQQVTGNDTPSQDTKPNVVSPVHSNRMHETPHTLIQTLKDEVAAFIPEAVGNGFEKEALLSSLAFILSKYSSPDIVLHREDIQQWIVEQCRTHSSVRISESELVGLWNS